MVHNMLTFLNCVDIQSLLIAIAFKPSIFEKSYGIKKLFSFNSLFAVNICIASPLVLCKIHVGGLQLCWLPVARSSLDNERDVEANSGYACTQGQHLCLIIQNNKKEEGFESDTKGR